MDFRPQAEIFGTRGKFYDIIDGGPGAKPPEIFEGFESRKYAFPP